MATQPRVTICPPHAAAGILPPEPVFNHVKMPVSATWEAGEVESLGISFQDYGGMHIQEHKLNEARRLETPVWVNNDAMLRRLLVAFMEQRAGYRAPQPGTDKERLDRAQAVLLSHVPRHTDTIDRLCKEFVAEKKKGRHTPRLKQLAIEIQNYDTLLRCIPRGPELILAIVQAYYRQGLNSVETAQICGIRPPHVRQTLWRLRETWKTLDSWMNPALVGIGPFSSEIRKLKVYPCAFCGKPCPPVLVGSFRHPRAKETKPRVKGQPRKSPTRRPHFCGPECFSKFYADKRRNVVDYTFQFPTLKPGGYKTMPMPGAPDVKARGHYIR